MNAELILVAVLLLISTITLYQIERRHIVALLAASIAAGLTHWLSETGSYVLGSVAASRLPYDALFMAFPVLIFTFIFVLMLAPPVIFVLERFKLLGTMWTVVAAGIISLAAQWWALDQAPTTHPFNVLVGVVAGLVFLLVHHRLRKRSPSGDCAADSRT